MLGRSLDPSLGELFEPDVNLDDPVELHVRAIFDDRLLASEALDDHGVGIDGGASTARLPSYRTLAETMAVKRTYDADHVLKRLARLAGAVESGPRVSDRAAVHATFLVERKRLRGFDEAIQQLGGEQADRVRFSYTRAPSGSSVGPLAPHA